MSVKKTVKRALTGILALMLPMQAACAAPTEHLSVSGAAQTMDGVVLYTNLLGEDGWSSGEAAQYAAGDYNVTINGAQSMTADAVINMHDAGQGTHFVICVDVSKSILQEQMPSIVNGLSKFFQNMPVAVTVHDRVSLYTFGEKVELVQEASANATDLINSVKELKPEANKTQMYEAIFAAINKAREPVADRPVNSMVILITDGTDDPNVGQEGLYTDDSIARLVQEAGVPIYTVAIRQGGQQHLDNLRRFSEISGGKLELVNAADAGTILTNIQQLAENTVIVHFPVTNATGTSNKSVQEYQLALNRQGMAIQDPYAKKLEVDWSILPSPSPSPLPTQPPTPEPTPTMTPTPAPTASPTPAPTTQPPTVPPTQTPEVTAPVTATPEPVKSDPAWLTAIKSRINSGNRMIVYAIFGLLVLLAALVIAAIAFKFRSSKKNNGLRDTVDSERADQFGGSSDAQTIRSEDLYEQGTDTVRAGGMYMGENTGTIRMGETASGGDTGTIRIDEDLPEADPGAGSIFAEEKAAGVELTIEERRADTTLTRTVLLENELVIGRLASCDVMIDDRTVSSAHLKIRREHDGLYVQDMNSQNGTRINGERLYDACPLRSGDALRIGRTTLKIYFEN